jgi:hypothetical protein
MSGRPLLFRLRRSVASQTGAGVFLSLPLNLYDRRTWLQPAGAPSGEIACRLWVEGQERWLRAKVLRSGTVEFSEIMPTTNPKRWKLAPPAAVSQAERALRDQTGCMVGSSTEPSSGFFSGLLWPRGTVPLELEPPGAGG